MGKDDAICNRVEETQQPLQMTLLPYQILTRPHILTAGGLGQYLRQ